MNPNILHVGLDVDDTQYHGSAFNKATGEVIDFRGRPTLKGLLTQLDKLQRHFRGCSIRLCYEASYVGFCLQRDLFGFCLTAQLEGDLLIGRRVDVPGRNKA